ncbi:glycosyl transferase [Phlegmacium glaucopus]|nr:glycosyl transferase [Phlegmacium glaucopus]
METKSSPMLAIERTRRCELSGHRANAVIVALVRNSDLAGITSTITQLERQFNEHFQYPYVLLNDVPFEQTFKDRVVKLTKSKVEFGFVPAEHWNQPEWIDETKASSARQRMHEEGVVYGGQYRNMCRFFTGFWFRHELLAQYRYYWRPDVKFYCDISYDPFLLQKENKVYGFTISLYEFQSTITSLWGIVKAYIDHYPTLLHPENALNFISKDAGVTYNGCHFWSNFEIADFNFWRSDTYLGFFDFLDRSGGFYYERWGDAPIHSIAVSLFTHKNQIHFFNDIGYGHIPYQHCPQGNLHARGNCQCNKTQNFDYEWNSCLSRFNGLSGN